MNPDEPQDTEPPEPFSAEELEQLPRVSRAHRLAMDEILKVLEERSPPPATERAAARNLTAAEIAENREQWAYLILETYRKVFRAEVGPKPLSDIELGAVEHYAETVARLVRIFLAPVPPKKKRGRPRRLPDTLPQQTYQEIAAVGYAVTDAPNRKHWTETATGDALIHSRERANLQVRFAPVTQDTLEAPSAPVLWGLLQPAGGVDTYLLAQVGAYLALREAQVTIALDDLIRLIGWAPRSAKEREHMRREVWQRLKVIDGLTIHGLRPGTYHDPDTGQPIDLTSRDALFRITGTRLPAQASFDPEQVPLEVTFVAGPFISAWRGNPQVLTRYGDCMPIAGIPGAQPSGAWARSIGLALNQRWREGAAAAAVTTPGEENKLCVKWRHYTRRELLTLFEPSPSAADVLAGRDPGRARTYWSRAIGLLKRAGVIGYYKEAGAKLPRYSWGDVWLDERLDVRPGPQWQEAAAQISAASKKAAKRRTRKKP